ncbi:MAG TPA: GAF domain-containing protein [Chryseolinea sp.]|nr:GAF domain-containing protein [Chryseolinea sp.]HPH46061.1 GAF domain-containing protein [Chryseolinea sp.]HPM29205.1 GAF domain-containing protein [Chryseolinea sp.]
MRKFFANNWIVLTIGVSLIASMIMAIRNKDTIERNSKLQQQSELVKEKTRQILSSTMHGLDLGLRGFALTKDDNMLRPYNLALEEKKEIFYALDSNLLQQGYNNLAQLQAVKEEVELYITFCNRLIDVARNDNIEEVVLMLREDRGYAVWKKYDDFSKPLFEFEDAIYQQALGNYNAAIRSNLILQVCIVLLVLPALFLFVVRIRKEREARHRLVLEVEMNDRQRVFNPGTEQNTNAKKVIESSIQNIRTASDFIMAMSRGEYDVTWNGLNDENRSLNKVTLAGNLIDMREKLKQVKLEDDQRNWVNEGLAKFSEIVRNNQENSQELAERCVSFLTKYLYAQQSSLFVLEGEGEDQYLKQAACYAFDRKKWIEKKIDIGSGLVGQAFLEGEVVALKKIPKEYIKITSGLGDATPSHLIIVPLKSDVHTVAMIEIASFSFFEDHQIGFLKKAGEFLASAILNSKTTHKMKYLLDQSRINEESMRQREEEMRQNMEELQATQEELIRKEREMQKRFKESTASVEY